MDVPLRELEGYITTIDYGEGLVLPAVMFTCPVCTGAVAGHSHAVPYGPTAGRVRVPKDGREVLVWKHESGTTIDDITLSPSYLVYSCNNFHGFVRNGRWQDC